MQNDFGEFKDLRIETLNRRIEQSLVHNAAFCSILSRREIEWYKWKALQYITIRQPTEVHLSAQPEIPKLKEKHRRDSDELRIHLKMEEKAFTVKQIIAFKSRGLLEANRWIDKLPYPIINQIEIQPIQTMPISLLLAIKSSQSLANQRQELFVLKV